MTIEQTVRLSHNGPNQVLNIPQAFELPGDEVVIRKEGERLIIEPKANLSLLGLLSTLSDIKEDFPDIDEGLLPVDDIEL